MNRIRRVPVEAWRRVADWVLDKDVDLRARETEAHRAEEERGVAPNPNVVGDPPPWEAIELVHEIARAESDREANLNGRGTAIAGVAALVVSIAGAVGKVLFDRSWDDWTRDATLGAFVLALVFLAAAMASALLGVLRPGRGGRTKMFAVASIVHLVVAHRDRALLAADAAGLRMLYVDRVLRTLPEWHVRNRAKARWLRRSYVLLLIGTVLIGLAGLFVLSRRTGIPVGLNVATVLAGVALVVLAIRFDWPLFSVPKQEAHDRFLGPKEIEEIAAAIGKNTSREPRSAD